MPVADSIFCCPQYPNSKGDQKRDVQTSISPSTGQPIGKFESATTEDVRLCAHEANIAYEQWSTSPATVRSQFLYRWATVIESKLECIANRICEEVGKPISESKGEASRAVAILRYYAGEAVHPNGELIPSQMENHLQFSERRPLGVVGLITPWNFPIAIPLWKAAPALAFGNAVILKPSELSPFCAQLLFETASEAGLPNGIFNVLPGDGSVGAAMVECDEIRAISFTGSAQTGKKVIEGGAKFGKKVQAEMGGKNPSIVLADAHLKKAATLIASAAFRFAGQKCTATSRVIVDRKVYGEFLEELKNAMDSLANGDPFDPNTAIGPVISESSFHRLMAKISSFNDELFATGTVFDSKGFYVQPRIYRDVDPNSPIAQEELFGPILAVIPCDGIVEAITIANSVPFGLSASIFTQNLTDAMHYMRKIKAGMIRVNADTTGVDPHAPFGGVKGSSYGAREQGTAARDFYTESVTYQIGS